MSEMGQQAPACLIGMEACVGAHHLSRKLQVLGHDARLMPAKYVRPYSKGQKNHFLDAEAGDGELMRRRRKVPGDFGLGDPWRRAYECPSIPKFPLECRRAEWL
jgi:transposase